MKEEPIEDGNTEMTVFDRDNKVFLRFKRPMLWVKFDPVNAAMIGKEIIDVAVRCGAQVEIKVPKRPITEQDRAKLIYRVGHIMRDQLEKNKNHAFISRAIVDSVLSEID